MNTHDGLLEPFPANSRRADLRESRMDSGLGTQQILTQYIESGGRQVGANRKNYLEQSKVKHFEPAQPPRSRGLGDRLSQSVRNFGAPPAGPDTKDGPGDGLSKNHKRSQSLRNLGGPPAVRDLDDGSSDDLNQNIRLRHNLSNFGEPPAGSDMEDVFSNRGLGDKLGQSVMHFCEPPAGPDTKQGSSDGLSRNHKWNQSLGTYGGSPAGSDTEDGFSNTGFDDKLSETLKNFCDIKNGSSDEPRKNHRRNRSFNIFGGPPAVDNTFGNRVASIVGDGDEFKRLKEDLRKSRTNKGLGTKQLLKQYIESGGLSKAKCFTPAHPKGRRGLGERMSQSSRNLDRPLAGHDMKHGSSDGLGKNHKRSQSLNFFGGSPAGHDLDNRSSDGLNQNIRLNQNLRNFGGPPAGPGMENGSSNRGLDRLSESFWEPSAGRDMRRRSSDRMRQNISRNQNLRNLGGPPAGRDLDDGSSDGLNQIISMSHNLRNFGGPPAGSDQDESFSERGLGDILSQRVRNFWGSPTGSDMKHGSSDGLSQNHRRTQSESVKNYWGSRPSQDHRRTQSESVENFWGRPAGRDV